MRCGLLVPTLDAGPRWHEWLAALAMQTRQPDRTLVIDSGSGDQTAALARAAGHDVLTIDRAAFDHGGTRQRGIEALSDCDIVVCLTQDSVLDSPDALGLLLAAFDDPSVAVAWGRQLPHHDANPLAAHARLHNYPAQSRVVGLADRAHHGLRTAFASNSFCAWRRSSLLAIGGFASRTLLAEDMLAAAQLLKRGERIAYVAEAAARHSHNYSWQEELRRYFDTGVLHASEPWLLAEFGKVDSEGLRFVRSEQAYLAGQGLIWRLRALVNTAAKLGGYRLGRRYRWLPRSWCRRLSMHPRWWDKRDL